MSNVAQILCPPSPLDLGLDKPEWREGQRETVDQIMAAFLDGKKFVMAAIPTGGGKCVAPETRVLTADLRWLPAKDLVVGDAIIGVDEDAHTDRTLRRLHPSQITYTGRDHLPCYRILLSTGEYLTSTDDHKWLCSRALTNHAMKWIRTDELQPGMVLKRFVKPWDDLPDLIESYNDAGYLAGVFDGEGSIAKNKDTFDGLEFTQRPTIVLDRVKDLFREGGFSFRERAGSKGTRHVQLDTQNSLRLLGQTRPIRLLQGWMNSRWPTVKMGKKVTIVEVVPVGVKEVVTLTTSTHTFIAEGFGSHNTIIAAAVQKMIGRMGLSTGRSIALTHTIQLQKQYRDTLKEARVITGRGNHLCELPPNHLARIGFDTEGHPLTAQDAPCAEGDKCDSDLKHKDGCAYYRQFWEAADAPMVIMNYAYAARILQLDFVGYTNEDEGGVAMSNPFRRDLLIADECHLAESAVLSAAVIKLNAFTMRRAGIEPLGTWSQVCVVEGRKTRMYENTHQWILWAKEQGAIVEEKAKLLHKGAAAFEKSMQEEPNSFNKNRLSKVKGELRSLNALAQGLTELANIAPIDESGWLVKRNVKSDGFLLNIEAQPLWGWHSAPRLLWQHFGRVLLMSATPGDPEIARVKLGIDRDDFIYIERPSTFPVANRPVYFWDCGKLGYNSTPADWERIADAIVTIAKAPQHLGRKGIVHSGSAANARRLVGLLNHRFGWERAFSHGDGQAHTREEALAEFIGSAEPRILVTASFTTGLDLPYIIGWQVIAKVPFGSLADDITARRKAFVADDGDKFGQRVYSEEAMNTVVQAAGRVVRSPDDTGPTFIIDGNFRMLYGQAFAPKFFKEAFQKLQFGGAQ